MYNEIFVAQLKKIMMDTPCGSAISLSSYLREGMMLINYVEVIEDERLRYFTALKSAFEPYQRESKLYMSYLEELIHLLFRMSMLCCNFQGSMMTFSINEVAAFSGDVYNNEVLLNALRPERIKVKIKDISREVFRLCWPNYTGAFTELNLLPSKFGFKNEPELEMPVYVQRHALQRLEERLGIVRGISHYHLYECLKSDQRVVHPQGKNCLVEYAIYDRKLGYLVCSVHEQKIIVRTFLFLTNDGTPEAKLLAELTRRETAVALAARILKSVDDNLCALAELSVSQLMTFKGIGEAKAIGIIAAMELYKRKSLQRPVFSFGLAKHTG